MSAQERREYALYRGDEFLDIGTIDYLAEHYGVKPSYIMTIAAPSAQRKYKGTGFIAVRLDDNTKEND